MENVKISIVDLSINVIGDSEKPFCIHIRRGDTMEYQCHDEHSFMVMVMKELAQARKVEIGE